ncbi:MBL fold metallo-hydrolase [Saccharibacillus alkalitolerans]|uniref:MBL fold metallo-hydrolase n=1 Tax=Saccharibacillus alkalitolerans TaxID=2705290 RepID=A0ABX0F3Z4_9BACL|nr:MBL fold metallo-hydrolase [Saccharibacillus alkalitolerans]NGZ74580.1 MBL fold metallo-hydrolase [Saccharibacillus alkalitolerans]
MMMNLQVWGGSGEHGRSCYRIAGASRRILLDCGIKKEEHGQYPLLDIREIPRLTTVFLSHAHEDHAMALPLLYKHGYKGEIWTTRATARQLEAGFRSWRKFVESRGDRLPYERAHIDAMRFRYLEDHAPPLGRFELPGEPISVQWGRSGHLAGSVWLRLEMEGKRIFFSGDYSRESELLASDPPGGIALEEQTLENAAAATAAAGSGGRLPVFPDRTAKAQSDARSDDLAIVDNAYGPDDEPQSEKIEALFREISDSLSAGGQVLLPLPAFGRSQDLLVWACERFPDYPVIAENGIRKGLENLLRDPVWLRPGAAERIRRTLAHQADRLATVETDAQRHAALPQSGPCLILSNDGMLESPASRWYAEQLAGNPDNLILLTGHVYRGTYASRLLTGRREEIRCRVMNLCYKVHQGAGDVRRMLSESPAAKAALVHAPERSALASLRRLEKQGLSGLHVLRPGTEIPI